MSSEGQKHTLRITEAFPEDEGTYSCVASNSAGKVRLLYKLFSTYILTLFNQIGVNTEPL